MATLVLQAAGSAIGGAIGGPVGAIVGRAAGGLAGAYIDQALLGGGGDGARHVEGPRLKDVDGLTSTEGAAIPRVYGRARIGGQLIWATRLQEETVVSVERGETGGGKGLGRGGGGRTARTSYAYFANLGIGLCEGPITLVRRVWADGRELDLNTVVMRVHHGHENQPPDPLIVAKEGAENAPAYRGLAYVVFERLALEPFGNRVPQFSFEVVRAADGIGRLIRAVCLIPGSTESGYDPNGVAQVAEFGWTKPDNRHQLTRAVDVHASLDALQALCPNLRRVALVVSWFGDDLRAGSCTIAPRVERTERLIEPAWAAGGIERAAARPVTLNAGVPAYGGTPSDASVVRLIQALKARGLEVVLYPFVMMDVAAGNALPNPYSGGPGQPPYPWRGRITCDPAPGRSGTADATPAAADQVAAFFGTAEPENFSPAGLGVAYAGPAEWSFRRLVLHYAHLSALAGGVDGFVLGSEMVGLTRVRSASGVYPAVAQLRSLAADVRAVIGAGPKLVYAADWTEYGAHVLEGGVEVRFPLDPLFADPAIDAVGIDYYPPISDWRDGAHLDRAEARSPYDLAYLTRRLGAGEAFDWFYASSADRAAQQCTPITDGAYGKPWTFRAKDLHGWWSNPHVERVNGVEINATAWVPRSKPIWLTEIGIPAADKGPNGPNVFPDPKSSESAYPPFSRGTRDDLAQARGLEAILTRFDPALPGHPAGANPAEGVSGSLMVDPASVFVWAWDARPYPAFPDLDGVWADGLNWQTGHWITGRVEGLTLDRLVTAIARDFGLDMPLDAAALDGFVDGYVIDRPLSARGALEPLCRLFGVDAVASGGGLRFAGRGGRAVRALQAGDLVKPERGPALRLVRAQDADLPAQVELGFTDSEGEYRRAAVASRRLAGASRRESRADLAVVLRRAEAQRLADIWLQDLWAGRETSEFALSPRALDLEVGDVVALPTAAGERLHRVLRIADGPTRRVETRSLEPAVYETPGSRPAPRGVRPPPLPGRPAAVVLDLPAATGDPTPLQRLAVFAEPWPGAVAVWRAGEGGSFALHRIVETPAQIRRTLSPLSPGPLWRWDRAAALDVRLSHGILSSLDDGTALAGGNLLAVQGPDGAWEILSAARAELIGPGTVRLSRLLRGLAGSEAAAARPVPAGATLVRLDAAVIALDDGLADLGRPWRCRIGPAGRDHAGPGFVEITATAGPLALKPLAPVRLAARRGPDGVTLSWIRRGRFDADSWEPVDIPATDGNAYAVDILAGGAPLRTLTADGPAILYPAAAELADFGAPQAALTLRVAQVSASVGRGLEAAATMAVE